MITPYSTTSTDSGTTPSGWRRLRTWIAHEVAFLPRPDGWGGYVAATVAGLVVAWLLWLLWLLLSTGFRASSHLVDWLTGGPVTRTITAGLRSYLDGHAAGLPATAGQLWTAWIGVAVVLFTGSVLGSRGARIGWALFGALSTAMVFAGTAATGRYTAAGATVAAWAVLSIVALHRTSDTSPHVTVINKIRPTADVDDES